MWMYQFCLTVCCCATCPCSVTTVTTRLVYLFFLFFWFAFCVGFLMTSKMLMEEFRYMPFCHGSKEPDCVDLGVYLFIYRVCFAAFSFFFALSLAMLLVSSSRDVRGGLQNGCWALKAVGIGTLVLLFLFFKAGEFDRVCMSIGLVGAALYIAAAGFVLIRFTLTNDFLVRIRLGKGTPSQVRAMYGVGVVASALVVCQVTVALIVHGGCSSTVTLVVSSLALCLATTGVAVVNPVTRCLGFLQGSVVSFVVMQVTWSAVMHNPSAACTEGSDNLYFWRIVSYYLDCVFAVSMLVVTCFLTRHFQATPDGMYVRVALEKRSTVWNTCAPVERLNELEAASSGLSHSGSRLENVIVTNYATTDVHDNEYNQVRYYWALTHQVFSWAALYGMMMLTLWYQPGWQQRPFISANSSAMWAKLAGSWMVLFMKTRVLYLSQTDS